MDHNKLHKDNKDHRDILKDHIERIRLYEERYQQLIYMEKISTTHLHGKERLCIIGQH